MQGMEKKEFYQRCAQILNTEHNYVDLKPRIKFDRITGEKIQTSTAYTRWGPRIPGNGRFPGFGLIRVFSPEKIFVNFSKPKSVSKMFNSYDEVINFLEELVDSDKGSVNIEEGGK